MSTRYAIYYAPPEDSPLGALGRHWFGRDASGRQCRRTIAVPGLGAERLRSLLAGPRLYGLHATLKPPFRLAAGMSPEALGEAVAAFARKFVPIPVPALRLGVVGRFVALVPSAPCYLVDGLAAACVAGLDSFRALPSPAELAQRRAAGLTPDQERMLQRWGYPYVFESFRFHLTLTDRIDDAAEREAVMAALAPAVAEMSPGPWLLDAISLFVQAEPGGLFRQRQRCPMAEAGEHSDRRALP